MRPADWPSSLNQNRAPGESRSAGKGQYVNETFLRRKDAEAWALDTERRIGRQEPGVTRRSRDVFLFLVGDPNPIEAGRLPDGSPDLYFRGFYCWNSEVGAKTLGIASFYLRAVCQNRNLWGVEDFQGSPSATPNTPPPASPMRRHGP
jgi:hypothetical protein